MIRSMLKWCLVSVLLTVTLASHPFVGKSADETSVKRDDGSGIAMRMKERRFRSTRSGTDLQPNTSCLCCAKS